MATDDQTRALAAVLLDGGQAQWLGRLRAELDRGGVFVAVGVGHLLGSRGLLAQLERAGYEVER